MGFLTFLANDVDLIASQRSEVSLAIREALTTLREAATLIPHFFVSPTPSPFTPATHNFTSQK